MDAGCQEPKQEQRGLVRHVQVVEHDQARTVPSGLGQEPPHLVEQAEASRFRIDRAILRALGRTTDDGSRGETVELPTRRSDNLDPWPVRGGAATLPAPAGQHAPADHSAWSATSSISRLLPIPGSPEIRNSEP